MKSENEEFYRNFCEALPNENGFVGTCAYALSEIARPEIKVTKSVLMSHTLRLGDLDSRQDEGFEISIKTSKCTSMHRPKSFKKYGLRVETPGVGLTQAEQDKEDEDRKRKAVFAQLKMRSEYYIDRDGQAAAAAAADDGGDVKMEDGEEEREATSSTNLFEKMEQVQKEELVRGFKYGSSYVPCPDGQFERLPTKKGIDICGFFPAKNVCPHFLVSSYPLPSVPVTDHYVIFSFVVNSLWEKFNISGGTRLPLPNRLRFRLLRRPWIRRRCWLLRDGHRRTAWIRRWEF